MKEPTGADFRAIRLLLGLSINDTVDLLKVNHRTINRWEREEFKVPAGAYGELISLLNYIENRVDIVIEQLDEMGVPDQINIVVYDNQADFAKYCASEVPKLKLYSVHQAMCARVLFENQRSVKLITFNSSDYEFWLEQSGLVDSQEVRASWAGLQ